PAVHAHQGATGEALQTNVVHQRAHQHEPHSAGVAVRLGRPPASEVPDDDADLLAVGLCLNLECRTARPHRMANGVATCLATGEQHGEDRILRSAHSFEQASELLPNLLQLLDPRRSTQPKAHSPSLSLFALPPPLWAKRQAIRTARKFREKWRGCQGWNCGNLVIEPAR